MIGKVFEDGEGRNGWNLLFAHDAHGFGTQLRSVIDGRHARLCRIERPGFPHCMHSNLRAQARGFIHSCFQLICRVLIGRGEDSVVDRIFPGLVDLDEIRSFFVLLANRVDDLVDVVCVGRI